MTDDREKEPEAEKPPRADAEGDEDLESQEDSSSERAKALRMAGQHSTLADIEEKHAHATREAAKHALTNAEEEE